MKKEFTRFECWEVVKNHPTFREVSTSTPPFSYSDTASTPLVSPMPPTFDVDEDEGIPTPQSNLEGSSSPVRPIGVKAAKEAKRKGKKVMTSSNEARDETLKSIAENQKSWLAKQQTSDAMELALYEKQLSLKEKDFKLRALAEESRIMAMDTEAMTPIKKNIFRRGKRQSLSKWMTRKEMIARKIFQIVIAHFSHSYVLLICNFISSYVLSSNKKTPFLFHQIK